jgi:hypothetical protein
MGGVGQQSPGTSWGVSGSSRPAPAGGCQAAVARHQLGGVRQQSPGTSNGGVGQPLPITIKTDGRVDGRME